MSLFSKLLILSASLLMVACVSLPSGPSIMALPGTGKSFEQFRNDDYNCRQFAYQQIGGETPNQAAVSSGAGSAIVGAGLGAAAGAAIGGGQGALIGAGTGLAAGGLVGTDAAGASGYYVQQRYDMSYIQCMYGQGHRVPVSGQLLDNTQQEDGQNGFIPPPPAGAPPPPPPW
jgi:outer membrane lipoprotein SlyB